ncbi:co-chaperone YbbN [Rhodococcus sp. YH3-3]|uniref:thioredoxin family protein n=1 Tax=Rhodococcus sp. YH3-3 TaxID=1803579 RepID=UPI0007DB6783|nr:thioredoxin domain-containing protein [Rhodococcus sp. YH3-3]
MGSEKVKCPNCGKTNNIPAAGEGKPRCGNCHEPLPWITAAGDGDFAEIVEKSSVPVLVDLWATWCGPCRMVSPALDPRPGTTCSDWRTAGRCTPGPLWQLAREHAGQIKLVKVDVDAAPRTAERFTVRAVPTLLVMDRGEVLARQSGAAPVPQLRTWLDQALSENAGEEAKS